MDSIHALLKGPVMSRAFEETRHFPMEHSWQGEGTLKDMGTHRSLSLCCRTAMGRSWFQQFQPVSQGWSLLCSFRLSLECCFLFFLGLWGEAGGQPGA